MFARQLSNPEDQSMSLRARGYLYDILDTARLIQNSTRDKTFDDYQADIGLCNVLNHQYPNLDHAKIWRTIESEVPILIRESASLLADDP